MNKMILGCAACLLAAAPVLAAPSAKDPASDLFKERVEVDGEKISIKQAIDLALQDSYQIIDAAKTREIYQAKLQEARASFYPTVSLSGTYGRALKKARMPLGDTLLEVGKNNTFSAAAGLDYILWSGGQVRNNAKLAGVQAEESLYQYKHTQSLVTQQVVKFCYDIIYASALIRVQEEYLDIAKQHLAETRARYREGLSSNLDVLNQKVQVENIEPQVMQAKKNFELGNLYLRQILNRDPEDGIYLTWTEKDLRVPPTPPLDELYALAMKYRPELVMSKLAVEAAHYSIQLAKSGHMPVLALTADYSYNAYTDHGFPQHRNQYYWASNAGLSLNIPLFEGFKNSSRVTQQELAYEQAVAAYKNRLKNVRIQVKDAYLNLEEAKSRIEATRGVVQQARENLNAQMLRYRNGLSSRLELNDATANVNDSDLQYVQAVYDAVIALSDLRYAVGVEVSLYEKKDN
ncbi:TolC family protein [Candidatus Avelusimicrobium facis]|uniref:TolC family protein n=1 Tax=Candidatus Avelusimicrobium facis TaxID=3416203 RepID=UPI0015B48E76